VTSLTPAGEVQTVGTADAVTTSWPCPGPSPGAAQAAGVVKLVEARAAVEAHRPLG